MRKLLFLFFVLFVLIQILTSCGSIKKVICDNCNQDSAVSLIYLQDSIYVPEFKTDTTFSSKIDSIFFQRDNLVIKYLRKHDTVYLQGHYKGDTLVREKFIKVKIPCNCPPTPKPTFIDKAKTWLSVFGLLSLVIFAIILFKK